MEGKELDKAAMGFVLVVCFIIWWAFKCLGCGSLPVAPQTEPDASEVDASDLDGSVDDVADVVAFPHVGAKCCQVEVDFTDDPYWHNGLYECDNPKDVPWVCGTSWACDDFRCVVGTPCQGFNGTGVVTDCKSE